MYQYFVKIVPTAYVKIDGQVSKSKHRLITNVAVSYVLNRCYFTSIAHVMEIILLFYC